MPDDDTAAKTNADRCHGGHCISKSNRTYRHTHNKSSHEVWRFSVAAAALTFAIATRADAGLNVCNKAKIETTVAVAQPVQNGWQSRGWWTIPSGQCRTLIAAPLKTRYYYLYATDGGAGNWSGKYAFCTERTKTFALDGRGRCGAKGYDSKGFFEIDTAGRSDWIQSLTD